MLIKLYLSTCRHSGAVYNLQASLQFSGHLFVVSTIFVATLTPDRLDLEALMGLSWGYAGLRINMRIPVATLTTSVNLAAWPGTPTLIILFI